MRQHGVHASLYRGHAIDGCRAIDYPTKELRHESSQQCTERTFARAGRPNNRRNAPCCNRNTDVVKRGGGASGVAER